MSAVPRLSFAAGPPCVVENAATPRVRVPLAIATSGDVRVRALSLVAQVRLVVAARAYDAHTRRSLREVWGGPEQWARAPRSLLWGQVAVQVPAFSGETQVDLDLPCSYDFEVAATKYLHALRDGEIPLELLFSGTVFFSDDAGRLQAAMLPASSEAALRMPAALWRQAMDRFFPDSAWLRLPRETFDRLWAFRTREALPTWEAALTRLLDTQVRP